MWKWDNIFDQPREGLKIQQFTSYEVQNGKLTKTVVTRKYYGDDYQDSTSTEIIAECL